MFTAKTTKHPVHGNGCRLEHHKYSSLDGTASFKPRRFMELPTEEEEIPPETDSAWCIDHGVNLPIWDDEESD